MPISGGTAGAHDDAMHQGSAKRDGVDGVAGLDGSGDVISIGNSVKLARSAGNTIAIYDRTSGEGALYLYRLSANKYEGHIFSSIGDSIIQLANMKDIASGIAALDAGGAVLAPGSELKLTRDGTNDIELVERTSAEIVARLRRVGVNDYAAFIHCAGNVCQFQHSGNFPQEEYSNHLGAVDNFTQSATAGNGTAATDAANHEMDLSSGNTIVGYGNFITKKTFTVDSEPLIYNCLIQNYVAGAAGQRRIRLGFSTVFDLNTPSDVAMIYHVDGTWYAATAVGASWTNTGIAALSSGDFVTIVVTSSECRFYVNGVVVANHTTNLPTAALYAGGLAITDVAGATTATSVSIDLFSVVNKI